MVSPFFFQLFVGPVLQAYLRRGMPLKVINVRKPSPTSCRCQGVSSHQQSEGAIYNARICAYLDAVNRCLAPANIGRLNRSQRPIESSFY